MQSGLGNSCVHFASFGLPHGMRLSHITKKNFGHRVAASNHQAMYKMEEYVPSSHCTGRVSCFLHTDRCISRAGGCAHGLGDAHRGLGARTWAEGHAQRLGGTHKGWGTPTCARGRAQGLGDTHRGWGTCTRTRDWGTRTGAGGCAHGLGMCTWVGGRAHGLRGRHMGRGTCTGARGRA